MKTIQRKAASLWAVAAVLILGGFFSACSNALAEKPGDPASGGTGGYVLVTIGTGIEARTILPRVEELFYTLTFSDGTTSFTENPGGAIPAAQMWFLTERAT